MPQSASSNAIRPWLLERLITRRHQHHWRLASFAMGLLGPIALGMCAAAMAGVYLPWATHRFDHSSELLSDAVAILWAPLVAGAYVSVLLALHVIASCRLPLTVRLLLVYSILYLSLSAVLSAIHQRATIMHVFAAATLCGGSFVQSRVGRWNIVSWQQSDARRNTERITIRDLLDLTGSIALTMGLLSRSEASVAGVACLLPACALFPFLGMHVWARLAALGDDSSVIASGGVIWVAGNIALACVLWLVLSTGIDGKNETLAVVSCAALLVIPVTHLWTELSIRWLRGCGWQLVRLEGEPAWGTDD